MTTTAAAQKASEHVPVEISATWGERFINEMAQAMGTTLGLFTGLWAAYAAYCVWEEWDNRRVLYFHQAVLVGLKRGITGPFILVWWTVEGIWDTKFVSIPALCALGLFLLWINGSLETTSTSISKLDVGAVAEDARKATEELNKPAPKH